MPADVDPALAPFYSQQLRWRGCDGEFQCATLRVPLDYADPSGPDLELALLRLPTSSGDERIGSLVLNPGGPGGSGIDYARAARGVTSDTLRRHFDIVGFDPRGVGKSNPIECLDDAQTDELIATDASPDTPAEVDDLVRISEALGVACKAKSPQLIEHMGTRDVARDLDVLRASLGDEHLNYLGKSYGTDIGATYAEMFPTHVGRMVLDGAIDPTLDNVQLSLGQAAGFELALRRFAEGCQQIDGCPLPANVDEAVAKVRSFLASVDAKPLTTTQGRPLNEALASYGIIGSLYSKDSGWETLSGALATAFNGDGSDLLSIADFYTDRDSSGHYTSNANDAIYAVNCWDRPATPDAVETEKLAAEWAKASPTFGAYLAWGNLPCATWPAHSSVAPAPVSAQGAPPIVVVGTTYDPATPVQWAKALADQLSSGVFLQWNGDGHTAYLEGSTCVDDSIDLYFVAGTPPTDGRVCD